MAAHGHVDMEARMFKTMVAYGHVLKMLKIIVAHGHVMKEKMVKRYGGTWTCRGGGKIQQPQQ